MTLHPLPNKVIVRPEQAATMTESGLHLAEHWKPEQRGTVEAIGPIRCPTCRNGRAPAFKVGDDVLFSWNVGNEILVNDGQDRLILLREEDILAVVEE